MDVFHVFKIVQMIPYRGKHHTDLVNRNALHYKDEIKFLKTEQADLCPIA